MALTSRNAILEACRRRTMEFQLDELGDSVRLRSLSALERARLADAWTKAAANEGGGAETNTREVQCRIAAHGMVDESGERIFGDGDLEAVGQINAAALDKICAEILRLSGLSAGAVEVAAKNLQPSPSEDSPTG